jgi:hypothetical protein
LVALWTESVLVLRPLLSHSQVLGAYDPRNSSGSLPITVAGQRVEIATPANFLNSA